MKGIIDIILNKIKYIHQLKIILLPKSVIILVIISMILSIIPIMIAILSTIVDISSRYYR
jgi:hypothetical protein